MMLGNVWWMIAISQTSLAVGSLVLATTFLYVVKREYSHK